MRGGPAEATNDQFYLLLPHALPGPGRPSASVVYRPYLGDTLSRRPTPVAIFPSQYPGWPEFTVWNVRGGPAASANDWYYLILPKSLPGARGMFPAEVHVRYDGGSLGCAQSTLDCTVQ